MGARSTGSHPTTTKADGHLLEYFRQNFGVGGGGNSGPNEGPVVSKASGGNVSAGTPYRDGEINIRYHYFPSSDTFENTSGAPLTYGCNWLVGGGGGGGCQNRGGGGGGAGGYRVIPGHGNRTRNT